MGRYAARGLLLPWDHVEMFKVLSLIVQRMGGCRHRYPTDGSTYPESGVYIE